MPTEHFGIFNDRGLKVRELERLGREFRQRQQYMTSGAFLQSPAGEVLLPPASAKASLVGCRLENQYASDSVTFGAMLPTWQAANAERWTFDTSNFLFGGPGTYKLKIPTDGYYNISSAMQWSSSFIPAPNPATQTVLSVTIVRVDGSSYGVVIGTTGSFQAQTSPINETLTGSTGALSMAAGDIFSISVGSAFTDFATFNLNALASDGWVSAYKVG